MTKRIIIKSIFRIIGLVILFIIFCLVGLLVYMFTGQAPPSSEIAFGITFSQVFAEEMGLDWQETYSAVLDDLKVKKLRLVAYWPKIEPNQGEYSFNDLDWQIAEAEKRKAEVILAVGRKLPRWPECHIPDWARDLSESEQQERILLLLTELVNRYQGNQIIKAWQVENEPFLRGFGQCPKLDKQFLSQEISLVRQLDFGRRPIILTASGELSSWIEPARQADILGTTLYRIVWIEKIGHFKYPIPAVFYYKRAKLVKWLTDIERIIIVELQAEPWGPRMIYETAVWKQAKSMNLDKFKGIIDYTWRTGFDEAYLWGVEWWYWKKEIRGNDAIWHEAKKLWSD
jgi:hypothetical protein